MSNQPVYRYPPRSHAATCRCPRCAPFRGRPLQSGAWIWVAIPVVAGIFWVVSAPLRIWHTVGRDGQIDPDTATYIAYGIPVGAIVLLMVFASIRATGKQRPPKGRLRVEATTVSQLKPPPASVCVAPPICLHRNAVRVESTVSPAVTLENWCPDCDAALGVNFRRSCCSTPPGSRPGDGHLYNCPHRKEQS